MTADIVQFPKRLGATPPSGTPGSSAIPFGPAALLEIAGHLNASAPEILDAVLLAGGSVATSAFMDYLLKLAAQ